MRRRRRSHRRGKNHTVRNIIIGCFAITLFLTTGYSAFQTNIKLNVKGNVKRYTVTFDANGGNVNITSKLVGTTYGDLPIPVREGYTFKGWNGKNLVNIEEHNISFNNAYYSNDTSNPVYILKPNTTYTLSFDYSVNQATNPIRDSIGYGNGNFNADIFFSPISYENIGRKITIFTTGNNFKENPPYVWFRLARTVTPSNVNVDVSNIQLEEGDVATDYEPYYITSETKVVQKKDHTLTAIWEEKI